VTSSNSVRTGLAAAVAIAALALATGAQALVPARSAAPSTDKFRTGGCTGCFLTQTTAAIAEFQQITRVFRGCGIGPSFASGTSNCAGGATSLLLDFFVLQGFVRDRDFPGNMGVGVSCAGDAGHADARCDSIGEVTYRISANGSSFGVQCARASSPAGIGFLAPEGLDGIPNTADDAGGTGVFAATGPGTGSGLTRTAAALAQCDTKLSTFDNELGTVLPVLGPNQLCVVDEDLDGTNGINQDRPGGGAPGARTQIGAGETSNLTLDCSTGFSDLPPSDFFTPKLPYNQPDTFGAQIFKFIVSGDVHDADDVHRKLHLQDPEVENLFSTPPGVCTWAHIGAESLVAPNVRSCIREEGSGSRETFRLTWMANTGGSAIQKEGTTFPGGTPTNCFQFVEGSLIPMATGVHTTSQNGGAGDLVNCVNSSQGAIGYADEARQPNVGAGEDWYGAVIEGTDPDAALAINPATGNPFIKDLVKCGAYRFWGPLSGGIGSFAAVGDIYVTGHRNALQTGAVFAANPGFLPKKEIGFNKSVTDGLYSVQFIPTTCPNAPPDELLLP
jgi:hypothetical protein